MQITAFAPGHITGLFHIQDESQNDLNTGSLGAGFSIDKGVTTRIVQNDPKQTGNHIRINGKLQDNATVSMTVINLFFQKTGMKNPYNFSVFHNIQPPMASGFGTSGAGALSLAIGLNRFFGSPLSSVKAAQIAHNAEIHCKTGLGTVIGEYTGGIEIRTSPGAPGIGKITQIPCPDNVIAGCMLFGSIHTAEALANTHYRKKINSIGKKLLNELLDTPTIDFFLSASKRFTDNLGLLSPNAEKSMSMLEEIGLNAGMLMFGDGVFTLLPLHMKSKVQKIFDSFHNAETAFFSDIDKRGGRITHEH